MPSQRYVTEELTHFVGRALATEEEQFERLLLILRSGRLHPRGAEDDDHTAMVSEHGPLAKRISTNELFLTHTVCFCDIPEADLGIHISKYGPFGIAFRKSFLVARGANPAFYVAAGDSPIVFPPSEPSELRAEVFDSAVNEIQMAVFELMECIRDTDDNADGECWGPPAGTLHHRANSFLSWHVWFFMKFFDPALTDDDRENFYMEREWRTLGGVNFELQDVRRIILPETFAERLRAEVPAYSGQVSFPP